MVRFASGVEGLRPLVPSCSRQALARSFVPVELSSGEQLHFRYRHGSDSKVSNYHITLIIHLYEKNN